MQLSVKKNEISCPSPHSVLFWPTRPRLLLVTIQDGREKQTWGCHTMLFPVIATHSLPSFFTTIYLTEFYWLTVSAAEKSKKLQRFPMYCNNFCTYITL